MVFMPHWPTMVGKKPIDLGLDRVYALLEKLGNPHHKLPPVIHAAGTNGKGSTLAFLRSIFEAAGLKVHAYTSPHLLNYNERITIAGEHISDDYLHQIMERCRIAATDIPVTFFEGTTVGAFLAFAENNADIVLLETGLGGRLDATNMIDQPLATIITPIGLDHTEYLGPTVPLIAREKAGIIKPKCPVICSLQPDDAFEVIEQRALQLEAPLFAYEYDWGIEKTNDGFTFNSNTISLDLPKPSLLGEHQFLNAATAVATCLNLEALPIGNDKLAKGVASANWPGRMQHITGRPITKNLPQGWNLWIDGAHNEAASFALANTLEETLLQEGPVYLVVGMTKGRDAKAFLQHFKDKIELVTTCLVQTEPSAQDPSELGKSASELGFENHVFDRVGDAVEWIVSNKSEPGAIVCCGSLYLTSDVLA